jgi:hypothetical protein
MMNAPDIEEAVRRFNQGCTAFGNALAAVHRADIPQYETESRSAWVEVVGALEWAVKYCLDRFCAERMTTEELEKANDDTFDKLLRRLAQHARPRFEPARSRGLHTARRFRNHVTHEAGLAPYRELRRSAHAVRGFLLDYLPILEEQLSPLPSESRDLEELPSATEPEALLQPMHRREGGETWLRRVRQEGHERLRLKHAQRYDATIASFEAESLQLLTKHALSLLDADRAPSAPMEELPAAPEDQLKELLLRHSESGLPPAQTQLILRMLPLMRRYPAMCIEAGWLLQTEEGLRFKTPSFPALLVGRHIAHHGIEAEQLSRKVGRSLSWAEAAWMAVSAGDDLESWARHLLAERDPLLLFERVVVTCAAFGATPKGTRPSAEMEQAYRLCVSALIAFCPWWKSDTHGRAPASPWFLPEAIWRQCILDLAQASQSMGSRLELPFNRGALPAIPAPLAEILAALGLPPRLSPIEASVIAALCAPTPAARQGLLDATFFSEIFSTETRIGAYVQEPFLEAWMRHHGIPTLREAGGTDALQALALPRINGPAGYLLNRASLIPEWEQAWSQLTATDPSKSIPGWVEAVQRLSSLEDSSEPLRRLLLEECLGRLEKLGSRDLALRALREAFLPYPPSSDGEGEEFRTKVAILRLLGLTDSEWRTHIADWAAEPALAWRTLIAAGAPQAAIASWCIRKLLLKAQAPEAFQEGPVGVIASSGAQILGSQQWEFAFHQAEEALAWLLTEGDVHALSVLANACLARGNASSQFNPTIYRMAGLHIPLSQVLWPRVLKRPEGRAALFARVERDAHLGEDHIFGNLPLPEGEMQLWSRLAMEVWKPQPDELRALRPVAAPPNGGAEARRLLACFEQRMSNLWIPESEWLRVKEIFENKGWLPPSVFPWRVQLPGNPWGQPWPLHLKALILACAAAHGADVAAPLTSTLQLLVKAPEFHASVPELLGYALLHFSGQYPGRAQDLLERALAPEFLRVMRGDTTITFWATLLRRHGSDKILTALDILEPHDVGLGLVDALRDLAPGALRERELRPEWLRPLLIRASEGVYVPSARFWEEAWSVERSEEVLPELPQLVPGLWLEELLDKSRRWEPGARQHLLRHLAGFSTHTEVRSRCLAALLG